MIEITISGVTMDAVIVELHRALERLEPYISEPHASKTTRVDENVFGTLTGVEVADVGDVRNAQSMEIRHGERARVGDVIRPIRGGIPALHGDFVVHRSDEYGVSIKTVGGVWWSVGHHHYTIIRRRDEGDGYAPSDEADDGKHAEQPDILTRIEGAAQDYLERNSRAPKVVILGVQECNEVEKLCWSLGISPQFRTIGAAGTPLRLMRDDQRESCLEVYG